MTDPLESLTDRELDARFWEMLGFEVDRPPETDFHIPPTSAQYHFRGFKCEADGYRMRHKGGHILAEGGWWYVPCSTRSLDAAWQGVEKFPEFVLELESKGVWAAFVATPDATASVYDPHPARAVVLACLKAKGD